MSFSPHDLAVQISDAQGLETFRLPLDVARRKAREVINHPTRNGLTSVVQNWKQLPDGQIEFVIRRFATAD
jgi:hypothetical protein